MTQSTTIVGILYPGEMGAALAALLRRRGTPVVTAVRERSDATARRAAECGAGVVPSLQEVVRRSDVLISLVAPSAAQEVAHQYAEMAHLAPPAAIFVDANSVGPDKAVAMARLIESRGRGFVDASINGLAKNLAKTGTLFLSGRRAADVQRLFDGPMRVRVLGDEPGKASAMKMLLGGLSKGLCGLFAELALLAERQGMLDDLLGATSEIYGGVAVVAERMLPTYARHAARRATEMNELQATARAAGLAPAVIEAVRELHEKLALVFPPGNHDSTGAAAQDLASTVTDLAARLKDLKDPT